jgi:hypothetical protein
MFQQVIIPEALDKFLTFDELKILLNVNTYISEMFLKILHKRTLWKLCHLPQDLKWVHRLKIFSWIRSKQFEHFLNIKELQIMNSGYSPRELCCFPDSLLSLEIGDFFFGPISGLPCNLRCLRFGAWCEASFIILPDNLQELIFGDDCTVNLSNCIFPSSLTRIQFGADYLQKLDLLIALDNLKEIRVNIHYDVDIPKELQHKITYVE